MNLSVQEVTTQENALSQQTEGARVLQVLEEVGLLGCMEDGDGKLSEDYKKYLFQQELAQ